MTYEQERDFLAQHTRLIELSDGAKARVAVAPQWQGRVMTSTCDGPTGRSFGFVNRDFIEAGRCNPQFNNYGAEERMWLCPEGGQFSLWFQPGAKQVIENWHTPAALNEGAWQVLSEPGDPMVRMAARLDLQNASGTTFNLDASRDVRLLGADELGKLFGNAAAAILSRPGVNLVAYETANRITNRGAAFSKSRGLVSIWILGMLNSSPRTVVLMPYKPGPESQLGPAVKSDYFGAVPADRLQIAPAAVLFRADAKHRAKIGASQRRACNVIGSIDFDAGVLTLVHFTMPDDPTKHNYLNNMWQTPQAEPFVGDVANAYNDGPNDLGSQLGGFYEIESVSPAPELAAGESLTHCHRTVHIQADAATLAGLAKAALGVDLQTVQSAMQVD